MRAAGRPPPAVATAVPAYAARVSAGPAESYYLALVGAWSGALEVDRSPPTHGLFARLLTPLARLTGRYRFETTLSATAHGFHHTTQVRKWGLLLLATEEDIVLDPGGRALVMTGTLRPLLGRGAPYRAEGHVDAESRGATYHIPWLGAELVQRTERRGEDLAFTHQTPWLCTRALLVRSSATPGSGVSTRGGV